MGCCASKEPAAPASGPVSFAAVMPMAPTAQAAAEARTVRLLESLAANAPKERDRPAGLCAA